MNCQRTKNAGRNIAAGAALKLVQLLAPFAMRTVLIRTLGMQYLGLDSLFTSVLQLLNLAELGVGSAMVYSMYGPVARGDTSALCALLRLYRMYYRAVGLAVAGIGAAFVPVLPFIVRADSLPAGISLRALYALHLAAAVTSYWALAYRGSVLLAHQRAGAVSSVTLAFTLVRCAMQCLAVCVFHSYWLYAAVPLLTQAGANMACAVLAARMFPAVRPAGALNPGMRREINRRIRDLFTARLGSVVDKTADTLAVSAALGLGALAVYQNYACVLNAVLGAADVVFTGCAAGIGNSLIVESRRKNRDDLCALTLAVVWFSSVCACCLMCLYQPFMRLWAGEEHLLGAGAVACFGAYYFVHELSRLFNLYKDAAGLWRRDRFRPLVTALVNLTLNFALVRPLGVCGVVLASTLASALVGLPWLVRNLFAELFDGLRDYLRMLAAHLATAALSCAAACALCAVIDGRSLFALPARGAVCCLVPAALFAALFHRRPEFSRCAQLAAALARPLLHTLKGGKHFARKAHPASPAQ